MYPLTLDDQACMLVCVILSLLSYKLVTDSHSVTWPLIMWPSGAFLVVALLHFDLSNFQIAMTALAFPLILGAAAAMRDELFPKLGMLLTVGLIIDCGMLIGLVPYATKLL